MIAALSPRGGAKRRVSGKSDFHAQADHESPRTAPNRDGSGTDRLAAIAYVAAARVQVPPPASSRALDRGLLLPGAGLGGGVGWGRPRPTESSPKDETRDRHLERIGYTVLRLPNGMLLEDPETFVRKVLERVETLPNSSPVSRDPLTPGPSPRKGARGERVLSGESERTKRAAAGSIATSPFLDAGQRRQAIPK